MKNVKDLVRQILGQTKKTDMAEDKLKDGTVVYADVFEVGQTLYVQTAEGDAMPAREGEHMLEDGRVVIVDDLGSILEIREAVAEEAAKEEEMGAQDFTARIDAFQADLNSMKEAIANLAKIAATTQVNQSAQTKLREVEQKYNALVAEKAAKKQNHNAQEEAPKRKEPVSHNVFRATVKERINEAFSDFNFSN